MPQPRVIIIGAGFGGLAAARALAKAPVEVVVLDQRNHHTFQPLLYQVATAALSPAEIAWPIRHLLKRQANARALLAMVESIDLAGRQVLTDAGPVPYDHLIVAAGATHAYFGHDDWATFAPGLKTIDDALAVRRRILMAFEEAERTPDRAEHHRLLTFVIVGGGPTGVEMAGAIAEVAHEALMREFRHIDPSEARVVLIEAGPRILPPFPEPLAAYAARRLKRMGVEIRTNTAVIGFDSAGVLLANGRVDAANRIWAAGVIAADLVRALPGEHDRAGRAIVGADLSLPGHPEVFVIGDAAAVMNGDGKPVPGIAPAAKQMGAYAGRLIAGRFAGKPAPAPFRYRHEGDLATIGRNAAVLRVRGVNASGFAAWVFWGAIHIYFLIGLKNRIFVALDWFRSYLTGQRDARLITGLPGDEP